VGTIRGTRFAAPLSQVDLDLILAKTRNLWCEIRNQRIFITGGTGFFGCWLIESFAHANRVLALDARAIILTRDPTAFAQKCPHLAFNPAITMLSGDVRDFAYPDGDFPYVIHAATETSARQAPQKPLEMTETILRGTERVLEFAATHGTRKFLFTSSGAVYGSQPASITHLGEDYARVRDPFGSVSEYAEGKRAAESMCTAYSNKYGIECKIARGFAFVGPHLPLDAHFAIGNFIRDAMRGISIEVNGDGTSMRSYMYAADLAIWLWTILLRAPANQVFNVGSDQAISILKLAHTVASAIGSPAAIRVAQRASAGVEVQQYVPSIIKAQQDLGLKCEVALQDAIRRTVAWHGYPPVLR
jgi:nucleoside-diphosphate-sugar epimerase